MHIYIYSIYIYILVQIYVCICIIYILYVLLYICIIYIVVQIVLNRHIYIYIYIIYILHGNKSIHAYFHGIMKTIRCPSSSSSLQHMCIIQNVLIFSLNNIFLKNNYGVGYSLCIENFIQKIWEKKTNNNNNIEISCD